MPRKNVNNVKYNAKQLKRPQLTGESGIMFGNCGSTFLHLDEHGNCRGASRNSMAYTVYDIFGTMKINLLQVHNKKNTQEAGIAI